MDIKSRENHIESLKLRVQEMDLKEANSEVDLSEEIRKMKEEIEIFEKNLGKDLDPWDRVIIARDKKRPTAIEYISEIFDDFIELHGDRYFADDKAIIGGIGSLNGMPVTIIAQQKGLSTKDNIYRNFAMSSPEGYRKALRLMKQGEKFNRPIISIVDTPGAYCGISAEERGQGEAIARNLFDLSSLKVPVISIFIGEGGSGGALALAICDRIYMLENSIYSILSPEGFASILWKDSRRAKEASEVMKITAEELLKMDIVEELVEEPPGGAHKDLRIVTNKIKELLIRDIVNLKEMDKEALIEGRYSRYRKFGEFSE